MANDLTRERRRSNSSTDASGESAVKKDHARADSFTRIARGSLGQAIRTVGEVVCFGHM
jgi:hypothetical protein